MENGLENKLHKTYINSYSSLMYVCVYYRCGWQWRYSIELE